jgi:hypothetical protein
MTTEINQEILSILFILDQSGSMSSMGDEPLQGLNSFYDKQKESGDFYSTLLTFNNDVKFIHKNIIGKEIKELKKKDLIPQGLTALYDAIGEGIEYQKSIKLENVLVVIMTDGENNASQKFKKEDIQTLISHMEKKYGWSFSYLGANQDSFRVATDINIKNYQNFEFTREGCGEVFRNISDTVSRCVTSNSLNRI